MWVYSYPGGEPMGILPMNIDQTIAYTAFFPKDGINYICGHLRANSYRLIAKYGAPECPANPCLGR
jgi:hypothetical protein